MADSMNRFRIKYLQYDPFLSSSFSLTPSLPPSSRPREEKKGGGTLGWPWRDRGGGGGGEGEGGEGGRWRYGGPCMAFTSVSHLGPFCFHINNVKWSVHDPGSHNVCSPFSFD